MRSNNKKKVKVATTSLLATSPIKPHTKAKPITRTSTRHILTMRKTNKPSLPLSLSTIPTSPILTTQVANMALMRKKGTDDDGNFSSALEHQHSQAQSSSSAAAHGPSSVDNNNSNNNNHSNYKGKKNNSNTSNHHHHDRHTNVDHQSRQPRSKQMKSDDLQARYDSQMGKFSGSYGSNNHYSDFKKSGLGSNRHNQDDALSDARYSMDMSNKRHKRTGGDSDGYSNHGHQNKSWDKKNNRNNNSDKSSSSQSDTIPEYVKSHAKQFSANLAKTLLRSTGGIVDGRTQRFRDFADRQKDKIYSKMEQDDEYWANNPEQGNDDRHPSSRNREDDTGHRGKYAERGRGLTQKQQRDKRLAEIKSVERKKKKLLSQINSFLLGSSKSRVSAGTYRTTHAMLKTVNNHTDIEAELAEANLDKNGNPTKSKTFKPFVISWGKLGLEPFISTKLQNHPLQKSLSHNFSRSRIQHEQRRVRFVQEYLYRVIQHRLDMIDLRTQEQYYIDKNLPVPVDISNQLVELRAMGISDDLDGETDQSNNDDSITHHHQNTNKSTIPDNILAKHNAKEIIRRIPITTHSFEQILDSVLSLRTAASPHDSVYDTEELLTDSLTNADPTTKHLIKVYLKVKKYLKVGNEMSQLKSENEEHPGDEEESESRNDIELSQRPLQTRHKHSSSSPSSSSSSSSAKPFSTKLTASQLPAVPDLSRSQLDIYAPPLNLLPSALQLSVLPHMLPYKNKDSSFLTTSPVSLQSFLHLKHQFENDPRELGIKVRDYPDDFLDTYELHGSKDVGLEYLPSVTDTIRTAAAPKTSIDGQDDSFSSSNNYHRPEGQVTAYPTVNGFHPLINSNNYRRLAPSIPQHTYDLVLQHFDQNERLMSYLPGLIQSITARPVLAPGQLNQSSGIKAIIVQPNREACVYAYTHIQTMLNSINETQMDSSSRKKKSASKRDGDKGNKIKDEPPAPYQFNAMRASGQIGRRTMDRIQKSPPDILVLTPQALSQILEKSTFGQQVAFEKLKFHRRVQLRQAQKLKDQQQIDDMGEEDMAGLAKLVIAKGNLTALQKLHGYGITFDGTTGQARRMTPQERRDEQTISLETLNKEEMLILQLQNLYKTGGKKVPAPPQGKGMLEDQEDPDFNENRFKSKPKWTDNKGSHFANFSTPMDEFQGSEGKDMKSGKKRRKTSQFDFDDLIGDDDFDDYDLEDPFDFGDDDNENNQDPTQEPEEFEISNPHGEEDKKLQQSFVKKVTKKGKSDDDSTAAGKTDDDKMKTKGQRREKKLPAKDQSDGEFDAAVQSHLNLDADEEYLVGETADKYAALPQDQKQLFKSMKRSNTLEKQLSEINIDIVQEYGSVQSSKLSNDASKDESEDGGDDVEHKVGQEDQDFDPIAQNTLYTPKRLVGNTVENILLEHQAVANDLTADQKANPTAASAAVYRFVETDQEREDLKRLYSLKNCSGDSKPLLFDLNWLVMDNADRLINFHFNDMRNITLHMRHLRRLQGKYNSHDVSRAVMACNTVTQSSLVVAATALRDAVFVNGCYLDTQDADDEQDRIEFDTSNAKKRKKTGIHGDDDLDDSSSSTSGIKDDEVAVETKAITASLSHLVSNIDNTTFTIKELLQFPTETLIKNRKRLQGDLGAKAKLLAPSLTLDIETSGESKKLDDSNPGKHDKQKNHNGSHLDEIDEYSVGDASGSEDDDGDDMESADSDEISTSQLDEDRSGDGDSKKSNSFKSSRHSKNIARKAQRLINDDAELQNHDVKQLQLIQKHSDQFSSYGSFERNSPATSDRYQEPDIQPGALTPTELDSALHNAINSIHLLQQGTLVSPLTTHTYMVVPLPKRLQGIAMTLSNKHGNGLRLYSHTDFQNANYARKNKMVGFERLKTQLLLEQSTKGSGNKNRNPTMDQYPSAPPPPGGSGDQVVLDQNGNPIQFFKPAQNSISSPESSTLPHGITHGLNKKEFNDLHQEEIQYDQTMRLQQQQRLEIMKSQHKGNLTVIDEHELIKYIGKKLSVQLDEDQPGKSGGKTAGTAKDFGTKMTKTNISVPQRNQILKDYHKIELDYSREAKKLNNMLAKQKFNRQVHSNEMRRIGVKYKESMKELRVDLSTIFALLSEHRQDLILSAAHAVQKQEMSLLKQQHGVQSQHGSKGKSDQFGVDDALARSAVGKSLTESRDQNGTKPLSQHELHRKITPTRTLVKMMIEASKPQKYTRGKKVANQGDHQPGPNLESPLGIQIELPPQLTWWKYHDHALSKSVRKKQDFVKDVMDEKASPQLAEKSVRNATNTNTKNGKDMSGSEQGLSSSNTDQPHDKSRRQFTPNKKQLSDQPDHSSQIEYNVDTSNPSNVFVPDGKTIINTSNGMVVYSPEFSALSDLELTAEYLQVQVNTISRLHASLSPRATIVMVPPNIPFEALAMIFATKNFKPGILHNSQDKTAKKNVQDAFSQRKINVLLCTDHSIHGMGDLRADLVVSWGVPSTAQYISRSQLLTNNATGVHVAIQEMNTGIGGVEHMLSTTKVNQKGKTDHDEENDIIPDEEGADGVSPSATPGSSDVDLRTGKKKPALPQSTQISALTTKIPSKTELIFDEVRDLLNISLERSFLVNGKLYPTIQESDVEYVKPVKNKHAHHYWDKYAGDDNDSENIDGDAETYSTTISKNKGLFQGPGDEALKFVHAKEIFYSPFPIQITRFSTSDRNKNVIPDFGQVFANEAVREAIQGDKDLYSTLQQDALKVMDAGEKKQYFQADQEGKKKMLVKKLANTRLEELSHLGLIPDDYTIDGGADDNVVELEQGARIIKEYKPDTVSKNQNDQNDNEQMAQKKPRVGLMGRVKAKQSTTTTLSEVSTDTTPASLTPLEKLLQQAVQMEPNQSEQELSDDDDDDDDDDDNDELDNAATGATKLQLASVYNQHRDNVRSRFGVKHSVQSTQAKPAAGDIFEDDTGDSTLSWADKKKKSSSNAPQQQTLNTPARDQDLDEFLSLEKANTKDLFAEAEQDIVETAEHGDDEQDDSMIKNKPKLTQAEEQQESEDEATSLPNVRINPRTMSSIQKATGKKNQTNISANNDDSDHDFSDDIDFEFEFDTKEEKIYSSYLSKRNITGSESDDNDDASDNDGDEPLQSGEPKPSRTTPRLSNSYPNKSSGFAPVAQPFGSKIVSQGGEDDENIPSFSRPAKGKNGTNKNKNYNNSDTKNYNNKDTKNYNNKDNKNYNNKDNKNYNNKDTKNYNNNKSFASKSNENTSNGGPYNPSNDPHTKQMRNPSMESKYMSDNKRFQEQKRDKNQGQSYSKPYSRNTNNKNAV